jgi:DNA topoisomerase-3
MGIRLYIAEKPSLAKTIASSIGIKKRESDHYLCTNGDKVTWLFGHLVGLKNPDEYDPRYKRWNKDHLPIIPDNFELKPTGDKSAQKQLKSVLGLLKNKTVVEVVNAGDPAREGQLLVDEIIEYGGCKKKVLRFWTSSLGDTAVAEAIINLKDNSEPRFVNLYKAGLARSIADWVIGLNITRAATLRARDFGINQVISVGRVQSSVLSLIVARDNEIDNFVASDYLIPTITVNGLEATWKPDDTNTPSFDSEGRLIDAELGKRLINTDKAVVTSSKKSNKKIAAPLPYSLSAIQTAASSKFGFSAKKTLDVCQKLYEAKYTTYPRSDSKYLPEDQFGNASSILSRLAKRFPSAENADATLKHKAWNSKEVDKSDHHAIMPDEKVPTSLSPDEEKIYSLICESFIQLFHPDQETQTLSVTFSTDNEGGQVWKGVITNTTSLGWRSVSSSGNDADLDTRLPSFTEGQTLSVDKTELKAKKTKPPSRFNDGTLIDAMSQIHKFVTDPTIRSQLRENSGIGTEATRAGIIETLIKRGYIKRKGKTLESTPLGKEVDAVLPSEVKDPGMTALWETYLKAIEQGEADVNGFYEQIYSISRSMTHFMLNAEFEGREAHKCPTCSEALIRMESKKKKGAFFWRCTSSENKCPLVSDDKGAPGEPFKDKN